MSANPSREPDPVPDAGAPPLPGALLSDEQVRWLRRAVVGMTAVLVAGIALLIGRVIYLARPAGTQAASSGGVAGGQPALLPQVSLPLPARAVVKAVSISGSRMAVTHAVPGGEDEISVLDLVTGKVVSRVMIERGK